MWNRKFNTVAVGFLMVNFLCSVFAQDSVPVEKEPMHRLKFENEFVRLFDVLVPVGKASHYHTVRGYTMRGHWRYLEHDWIAKPGTFIYEPAGEAHTLVITEDSPEPAIIFFAVEGGLIYLDKPVDGGGAAYEDGFTVLEFTRQYYRDAGLDVSGLDALVR